MAARVRLKMQCGTVALLPFVVFVVMCGVDVVSGMFEHSHCSHQHPRHHEVSPRLLLPLFRSQPRVRETGFVEVVSYPRPQRRVILGL